MAGAPIDAITLVEGWILNSLRKLCGYGLRLVREAAAQPGQCLGADGAYDASFV